MSALRAPALEPRKRLHMVGNAHLDVTWLWPCWEGFNAVNATFRSALERMREYPEFQFSASSAAYYEWVEQNNPAMFAEIRQRVAEGRWHLVGGWWVEPDCNIPGGEALVRQALLGQRYFEERFGRRATVGYNLDSFGHPGSLPQILLKSGLDAYVFMRPQPHERKLPARVFDWESPDGSRVVAFRVPFEYCTSAENLVAHVERCAAELAGGGAGSMCFFGVGNHGGGPTQANIETIQRLAGSSEVEVFFSSPPQFFDELRSQVDPLPVVHGELQHHASGCYAAHSGVKQWNRRAEHGLLLAEKFSAIAHSVTGLPYPLELQQAWKSVLLNQFHDVLAGTSLEATYADVRDGYGEASAVAGRALHRAIQSIAARIGIPYADGSTPIVVFNPHPWPTSANLELETDGLSGATGLVDEQGQRTDLQTIPSQASVGQWRRRVTFTTALPALGYRVLRCANRPSGALATVPAINVMENRRWRLTIDPKSGGVSGLFDRVNSCESLAGSGGRAVVIADPSDTWGHGVLRFQEEVGSFSPVRIQQLERGPVRSLLRVESRYGASTLIQDFMIAEAIDLIEVRVMVDWHERHKALKLRWPVNVRMPKATYETPYGTIERPPTGDEEPGHSWFDVSGTHERLGDTYGLSILNDGKHSFDVRGSEMSLTVLRSPAFAHHDPYRPESWEAVTFMDQGVQRFVYGLLPHTGDWAEAGTARRAAELNQRPIAMVDSFHEGPLAPAGSFVEASPDSVVVTALKLAEDGSGDVILRGYETSGRQTRGTIRIAFLDRVIEAVFGPHEIKTFRVGQDIKEVNLLECSA